MCGFRGLHGSIVAASCGGRRQPGELNFGREDAQADRSLVGHVPSLEPPHPSETHGKTAGLDPPCLTARLNVSWIVSAKLVRPSVDWGRLRRCISCYLVPLSVRQELELGGTLCVVHVTGARLDTIRVVGTSQTGADRVVTDGSPSPCCTTSHSFPSPRGADSHPFPSPVPCLSSRTD